MANQSYDEMELSAEKELAAILNDGQLDPNVDIDKTLNDKAKKTQLTKNNVKNLIKNVLSNDDVATMLRQTLDDYKDGNCLYEPKLTRAKIREMLKTYPPSVHQWSINQQESIISECRLLIEKEFPDDSEDEEYHPDKALDYEEEDDDDDESKCTEINKSFETEGEPENDADNSENTSKVTLNDKETIGMRTRSKFSLNDTPLEIIEQAFIPPDITEDMYDSACENDEWMEFLSEFTKPLESVQNDDAEDDPEYNVLCDDDFTNVDKEEFRVDKSVKISRKEYNDLMNELYEFTESYIQFNGSEAFEPDAVNIESDNNKNLESKNACSTYDLNDSCWKSNVTCSTYDKNIVKPIISIPVYTSNYSDWKVSSSCPTNIVQTISDSAPLVPQLNYHQIINETEKNNYVLHITTPISNLNSSTEQRCNDVNDEFTSAKNSDTQHVIKTTQENSMTKKQIILLKQQLTQHVQTVTQSYLLCSKAKKCHIYRRKLKGFLEKIKDVTKDKNYEPINIHASFKFIEDQIDVCEILSKNMKEDYSPLSPDVKELMLFYEHPLFVYPQLLPTRTLSHDLKPFPIEESEEKFLILRIDHMFRQLKEKSTTRRKYKKMDLTDMMPVILPIVHRRWFSHRKLSHLKSFITRRKLSFGKSITKNYFVHGVIDETIHIVDVGALFEGKCLYECNINKFPSSWKSFIKTFLKKKKLEFIH